MASATHTMTTPTKNGEYTFYGNFFCMCVCLYIFFAIFLFFVSVCLFDSDNESLLAMGLILL